MSPVNISTNQYIVALYSKAYVMNVSFSLFNSSVQNIIMPSDMKLQMPINYLLLNK